MAKSETRRNIYSGSVKKEKRLEPAIADPSHNEAAVAFTKYYTTKLSEMSSIKSRKFQIEHTRNSGIKRKRIKRYAGEPSYAGFKYYSAPAYIGIALKRPVFYNRLLALLFVVGPYVFSHIARTWLFKRILVLSEADFELLLGWLLEHRNRIYRPIQYLMKLLKNGKAEFENPDYYINKFNYLVTTMEFLTWSHNMALKLAEYDYTAMLDFDHSNKSLLVEDDSTNVYTAVEIQTLEHTLHKRSLEFLRKTIKHVKLLYYTYDKFGNLVKLVIAAVAFNYSKQRITWQDFVHAAKLTAEYYDQHIVYVDEVYNDNTVRTIYPPFHPGWRANDSGAVVLHQAHFIHPYNPKDITKLHPFIASMFAYVLQFDPTLQKYKIKFVHAKLLVQTANVIEFLEVPITAQRIKKFDVRKPSSDSHGFG